MKRFLVLVALLAASTILSLYPQDAAACSRCGIFGRGCRFASYSYGSGYGATVYPTQPQTIVFNNNYPNALLTPLAPQGLTAYGVPSQFTAAYSQIQTVNPQQIVTDLNRAMVRAQDLAGQLPQTYASTSLQLVSGQSDIAKMSLQGQNAVAALMAAGPPGTQAFTAGRSQTFQMKMEIGADGKLKITNSDGTGPGYGPGYETDLGSTAAKYRAYAERLEASVAGGSGGPGSSPRPGISVMASVCAKCHAGATPKGALIYDGETGLECNQITRALKQIRSNKMPPPTEAPLSVEQKGAILEELLSLERKEE